MESQLEFRTRCEAIFAEVVIRIPSVISWRLLERSNSEGGPTFEAKFADGRVRRHVVPDFHIVTGESDSRIRADFEKFLDIE